jgi:L-threonylcarbamoyladenylate synthase
MLRDEVAKALKVIQDGGIILYPTDTIWGIGCDATNTEAVQKIYKLKQRDDAKSMIILLDADHQLERYVAEHPVFSVISKLAGSIMYRCMLLVVLCAIFF